jgi:hypothetical protein
MIEELLLASSELEAAGMLPRDEFYKQGKVIISKLLKENAIPYHAYRAVVGDNKIGEKILQRNVFLHHFYANNVTFQLTLVKRYCELHRTLREG